MACPRSYIQKCEFVSGKWLLATIVRFVQDFSPPRVQPNVPFRSWVVNAHSRSCRMGTTYGKPGTVILGPRD